MNLIFIAFIWISLSKIMYTYIYKKNNKFSFDFFPINYYPRFNCLVVVSPRTDDYIHNPDANAVRETRKILSRRRIGSNGNFRHQVSAFPSRIRVALDRQRVVACNTSTWLLMAGADAWNSCESSEEWRVQIQTLDGILFEILSTIWSGPRVHPTILVFAPNPGIIRFFCASLLFSQGIFKDFFQCFLRYCYYSFSVSVKRNILMEESLPKVDRNRKLL